MKANSLIIALFLGNTEAVQVSKFLSPLHLALQEHNIRFAQIESSSNKFMSISGQLDSESKFEASTAAKLDDFVQAAHEQGVSMAKTSDNQKYDSKAAIQDTVNGVANLGSALEESKKEILKQKEAIQSLQKAQDQKAPESQSFSSQPAQSLSQTDSSSSSKYDVPAQRSVVEPMVIPQKTGQAPITASQLADDALATPFNINSYIDQQSLDKQDFPTGQVKTDQVSDAPATDKKTTHSTLTQAEPTPSTTPTDAAPASAAANPSTTPSTPAATPTSSPDASSATPAATPSSTPASTDSSSSTTSTSQPAASAAQPEKKEEPNLDQQAAHLEFLSKKVTDSVNGVPGSSISMSDMVNGGQGNGPKPEDKGKLSNQDIMNVINSFDQTSASNDAPVRPSFSGQGFRVDLNNEDGAGYVGTIFLGSEDQPAKVLFDTGSDFLAVTSDLCLDQTLGKQEVDEPVFNTTSFVYVPSGKDLRKCKSTAYLSKESKTGHRLGKDDEQLDYGSAKLSGKLFNDKTCLDPNRTACVEFDFLGLYQAKGLDDIDGILGLAVHPEKERRNLNYVWTLKNQKVIDQAIVSFSIAGPESSESSYAIFGGLNADQIVGGVSGLKKIQTMAYRPDWMHSVKQWALEGRNMFYGGEEFILGQEQKYPAIIDTGSSNFGVPEKTFNFMKEKWEKDIGRSNLDCVNDDNFCQVMTPCNEIAPKLKPVGIQISEFVFEMKPELYLHQAEGTRCQFAIHQNQMKGSSGNLYLIGDTLLRHLYQVYDFEHETIALGINTHSEGKISMYEASKRPDDGQRAQVDDGMSMEQKARFNDQF